MSSPDPIVTTKNNPGSYDAIGSAKADEPLFPIQGGDPFGPPTVLHWVKLCRQAGMDETDPKKAERLLRKATDAETVAWAMMAYQRGEQELVGHRATYHDTNETLYVEADDARKQREALIRARAAFTMASGSFLKSPRRWRRCACTPPPR